MQTTREMNQWDYFYHAGRLSHCFNKNHRHLFLEATHQYTCGKDNNGSIFVHLIDNAVVGVSGWYLDDHRAYLRWHGVIEKYRKIGVSKTLLGVIKNDLKSRGINRVLEMCITEESKNYFIKNGFVDITDTNEVQLEHPFKYLLSIDL